MEQYGPLRLAFELHASPESLVFEHRRSWLFGISVPRAAAVTVSARADGEETGWRVCVVSGLQGQFPWRFAWLICLNDIPWLPAFTAFAVRMVKEQKNETS